MVLAYRTQEELQASGPGATCWPLVRRGNQAGLRLPVAVHLAAVRKRYPFLGDADAFTLG